jgi:hypothetical protein
MNKSLENVLKALEQDALAFCSESDWAIVVAECEKAGNVRRVSKSAQVILEKAMSRSEAGRFAAEQRWKGHVAATNATSGGGKKVKSRFASPEIKTRAGKIMTAYLKQNGLDDNTINSIMTGVATNDYKRLARKLLTTQGFTMQQITEFVGNTEYSGGKAPKIEYTFSESSSEVPEGFPPSTLTADSPKDVRLGYTPKPANRGSGSFDDGTPFTGKFSSPTNNEGEGEGTLGTSRVNHPVYKTPKYKAEVKAAALYQLHGEIVKMHRQAGKQIPNSAKPYMDALNSLSSVYDMYGMDSGKSIVAYTMSNIKFFGEQGKVLKAELSARLK